jgi:hypothetical protein
MNSIRKMNIKNIRDKTKRLADRLDGYLKAGKDDYVRLRSMEATAQTLRSELSNLASVVWKDPHGGKK